MIKLFYNEIEFWNKNIYIDIIKILIILLLTADVNIKLYFCKQ